MKGFHLSNFKKLRNGLIRFNYSIMNWIQALAIGEYLIFGFLIVMSIITLGIILDRKKYFSSHFNIANATKAEQFLKDPSALLDNRTVFASLIAVLQNHPDQRPMALEYRYKHWVHQQRQAYEKNLIWLASFGANAPFVGLLGTILGIIESFAKLSNNQVTPQTLMSSIAVALVSTALGILVAIPAVIGFNYYSHRVKLWGGACDSIKNLYLSNLRT